MFAILLNVYAMSVLLSFALMIGIKFVAMDRLPEIMDRIMKVLQIPVKHEIKNVNIIMFIPVLNLFSILFLLWFVVVSDDRAEKFIKFLSEEEKH